MATTTRRDSEPRDRAHAALAANTTARHQTKQTEMAPRPPRRPSPNEKCLFARLLVRLVEVRLNVATGDDGDREIEQQNIAWAEHLETSLVILATTFTAVLQVDGDPEAIDTVQRANAFAF